VIPDWPLLAAMVDEDMEADDLTFLGARALSSSSIRRGSGSPQATLAGSRHHMGRRFFNDQKRSGEGVHGGVESSREKV